MKYWTFKHKPGEDSNEKDSWKFVEKAIKLNSALMQYEYGIQKSKTVTMNWQKIINNLQVGDLIFLRGDAKVYAFGEVIRPRKKPDAVLNARKIIKNKDHEGYHSGNFNGCIHFEDSEVFYEDLNSTGESWGQRVDVRYWMYYDPGGINAKKQNLYIDNENEFGVLKQLKDEAGKHLLEQLKNRFMDKNIELLKNNYNMILTGAPGTGKTFLAKEMALKLIIQKPRIELLSENERQKFHFQHQFTQFHPSYDYTDFVEGLRPFQEEGRNEIGFELKDGIFREFCDKARDAWKEDQKKPPEEKRKFVFIIDEINRGELSKIFGELFFSIDPGYRGEEGKVMTQYANMRKSEKDKFFDVPKNVYIIGTMNDIDRSVESFDFAMRRRFIWKEITAQESAGKMSLEQESIKRMVALNDTISSEIIEGLNASYHIGPAYFLKLQHDANDKYNKLWDFHLAPLLKEYLRGMPNYYENFQTLENAYKNKWNEVYFDENKRKWALINETHANDR